jgi:hypothetical protein
MIEQELTDLFTTDFDGPEVVIPAPRSGRHYELWKAEVEGFHGCLDAPVGD